LQSKVHSTSTYHRCAFEPRKASKVKNFSRRGVGLHCCGPYCFYKFFVSCLCTLCTHKHTHTHTHTLTHTHTYTHIHTHAQMHTHTYLCVSFFDAHLDWLPISCSFTELKPLTQTTSLASLWLHVNMTKQTNWIGDLTRYRSPLMAPHIRMLTCCQLILNFWAPSH